MPIHELTDLNDPALDLFARLTDTQLRRRQEAATGVFVAESPKVIHLALDAGCTPLALLMERRQLEGPGAGVVAPGRALRPPFGTLRWRQGPKGVGSPRRGR